MENICGRFHERTSHCQNKITVISLSLQTTSKFLHKFIM